SQRLEWRDRALGNCNEGRGAFAVVRGERLAGRSGSGGELGHVPEALSLGPERILVPGLHAERVLDESLKLRQARFGRLCSASAAPTSAGSPRDPSSRPTA